MLSKLSQPKSNCASRLGVKNDDGTWNNYMNIDEISVW